MIKKFLTIAMCGSLAMNLAEAEEKIPYPEEIGEPAALIGKMDIKKSKYYTANDFYNMKSTKNLVILKKYPTYQQTTEYTCGPAAGLTVMYYYGEKNYDEKKLAEGMKTQGYPIGTNTQNIEKFYEGINWKVESSLKNKPFENYADFKNFVIERLLEDEPIMVENVEWGGHWRVIIGYDTMGTENELDDVLIMADSYDTSDHVQDGYAINNGWRFYSMWFDHSMLPKKQRTQPWVIARPKNIIEKNLKTVENLLRESKISGKTNQIILVVDDNLSLWDKKNEKWTCEIETKCGIGKKGLTFEKIEGDLKTPAGIFPITYAAGFSDNPGTKLEYKKITPYSYISMKNDGTYNKWMEMKGGKGGKEEKEYLMEHYEYKYLLNIGYNENPAEYGKGSAIFIRCRNYEGYETGGSVSVTENKMLELLKKVEPGAYVIIVPTLNDIQNVDLKK